MLSSPSNPCSVHPRNSKSIETRTSEKEVCCLAAFSGDQDSCKETNNNRHDKHQLGQHHGYDDHRQKPEMRKKCF